MGIIGNFIRGFKNLFSGKKQAVKKTVKDKVLQKPIEKTTKSGKIKSLEKKVPEKPVKKTGKPVKKKTELVKEIKLYRSTIKDLRIKIQKLENEVEKQKIAPAQALGGVKVIYQTIKSEKKNVDLETKKMKSLMQMIEKDFLQRKISEDMFRKKMFDYREKIHLLQLEKKELSSQKKDLKETTQKIPQAASVSLEQIAKTENLEKLLVKQQETLEKIAQQRPAYIMQEQGSGGAAAKTGRTGVPVTGSTAGTPIKETQQQKPDTVKGRSAEGALEDKDTPKQETKFVQKAFEKAPDSTKINKFLDEKAKGKIDETKRKEIEEKLGTLMERHDISEQEIEKRLKSTSTEDLVESINKLVKLIELEKKTKQNLKKSEKIETAMRFTTPMKHVEEVKGIATEIKKYKIVTDFDKIAMYIAKEGQAKTGKIAKETGITKKRVEECCVILEKEKQIEIKYPAIGDSIVQTPEYKEKMEMEKLKKKENKK